MNLVMDGKYTEYVCAKCGRTVKFDCDKDLPTDEEADRVGVPRGSRICVDCIVEHMGADYLVRNCEAERKQMHQCYLDGDFVDISGQKL